MAKRDARKHIKTPALSAVEKLLYVLILLLSFALAAGAFCWMQFNPFRDPDVVACTHGAAPLLVLPFCLLAVVSGIACFVEGTRHRIHLFNGPARTISKARRLERRKKIGLWCAGLVLCMLLVPLGVSSRECLLRDHSIVRYNIFNQTTAAYSAEELTHFRIRIFQTYRRNSFYTAGRDYGISLRTPDGQEHLFNRGHFRGDSVITSLEAMAELKAAFDPENITISGAGMAAETTAYLHMTGPQSQMLLHLVGGG